MPKGKGKGKGKGKEHYSHGNTSGIDANKPLVVRFNHVGYGQMPTSGGAFAAFVNEISPESLGDRVALMSTMYENYRVTHLNVMAVLPAPGFTASSPGPVTPSIALAYNDAVLTSGAGGYDSLAQFGKFVLGPSYQYLRMVLSMRDLVNTTPYKWFRTKNTGSPSIPLNEITQGYLYFASYNDNYATSSSVRFWVHISGVIEFTKPVDDTLRLVPAINFRSRGVDHEWQLVQFADEKTEEPSGEDEVLVNTMERSKSSIPTVAVVSNSRRSSVGSVGVAKKS